MNSFLKIYWNLAFNLTGLDVSFDAQYKDWSFYLIEFKASYPEVKNLLAGRNLVPQEFSSGETRLQIVGCEMRSVQISGPYNEVSIQVPVNPLDDSPGEKFTHLFLPVSTEAARWPGVDIYGFPKFMAEIDFARDKGQISCQLAEQGESILEFRMDDEVGTNKRKRWEFYGKRKGRIVKTVFELEGSIAEGGVKQIARFVLGKHEIADSIKKLLLSDEIVRTMVGHQVSGVLRKPIPIDLGENR